MNNIETMNLALEALETAESFDIDADDGYYLKAITALRQAIEQAQQAERALDCTRVACMGNGGCVGSCWNNDTSQERVDETAKQRHEPCGLECDCTDVCKQDNYKALWEQMCERCDELDKQLAEPVESIFYIPCCTDQTCSKCKATISLPRQPLSDEQLETMAEAHVTDCYFDTLKYARAIEKAHGIKRENT